MKRIVLFAVAAFIFVGCTPKDEKVEAIRKHTVEILSADKNIKFDADDIEITKCDYSVSNPVLMETAITLAETDHSNYTFGAMSQDEFYKHCRERLDMAGRVLDSWLYADKTDSLRCKEDPKHPVYRVVAPVKAYTVLDDTVKFLVYWDYDGQLVTTFDIVKQMEKLNRYMSVWI